MPQGEPEQVAWWGNSPVFAWGRLRVIESDDQEFGDGEMWKHVSFSCRNRLPDWEEIKAVRMRFFPPDGEVIQVLPPVSEYVNNHAYTLHLWQCKTRRLTPPEFALAVGMPGAPEMK